jgi:hypothetical protein
VGCGVTIESLVIVADFVGSLTCILNHKCELGYLLFWLVHGVMVTPSSLPF